MKYLQLEQHLIPIILIKRVEQAEEEGEEDGTAMIYLSTVIHFRDGTEITVEEDFDIVCSLLTSIAQGRV